MPEAAFAPAIGVDAVEPGKAVKVTIGGRDILICNSQGAFFAVENKCSHADEALECGRIRNGWISCPAHGARFDLESGEAMNPPAKDSIATFPLRVVDGMIEVAAG
ncbi:MAG: Rieske 2Fe-2S domain-containing protein [Novosphingobium sp.]|nr:Rieske 2Fe-2S domain-containing protein [Novosphingobium sp.]